MKPGRVLIPASIAALLLCGLILWWLTDRTRPPNILLIVLDDFGYNDLGANGNPEAPTPNLDRFAAEGVRYTRHYADATCTATRVALLTGTFAARYGFRPAHLGLSPETPTIASALRERGYATHHIGKWHVGNATPQQSPLTLGFDHWFGFLFQHELQGPSADGIHFNGPGYENPWLRTDESPPERHEGHLTDILADRTIAFLEQRRRSSRPWFLNLWFYAPHAPIQPAPEYRARHARTPAGEYRALLEQLDDNINRVLVALDENGHRDDTLVIVVSDNGGVKPASNFPFRGKKMQFSEGGLRTPLLMRWPGKIKPQSVSDEVVSIQDLFPTVAAATGAVLPPLAFGRDLLADRLGPSGQLYWELGSDSVLRYSVLSADGRWRLSGGTDMKSVLNDLHTDPTGTENVIDKKPAVAAALQENYLNWRSEVRVVDFRYEPLRENGRAILTHRDLERSPGYQGSTFAIGVTPATTEAARVEVIAQQGSRWRLYLDETRRLQLEMPGAQLSGPLLPVDRCSEVVVSSFFRFSPIHPHRNKASIHLYVNSGEVTRLDTRAPTLQTADYHLPTYVGTDPEGEFTFQGSVSRPVILNESVLPDTEASALGNGVSSLPPVCEST